MDDKTQGNTANSTYDSIDYSRWRVFWWVNWAYFGEVDRTTKHLAWRLKILDYKGSDKTYCLDFSNTEDHANKLRIS